jgi:DNA-binding response OmpR family regulator
LAWKWEIHPSEHRFLTGDSLWDALSDPSGSAEFDIALLDVMLPGRTSVDVLTALPVKPRCVCIAMTAGVDSVAVENLKYVRLDSVCLARAC